MNSWRERARRLKVELFALYLAARHPQTPWYAKLVVAGFVAYAVTPVDLVPDAIPILGLIDDLIFVPLAIAARGAVRPVAGAGRVPRARAASASACAKPLRPGYSSRRSGPAWPRPGSRFYI